MHNVPHMLPMQNTWFRTQALPSQWQHIKPLSCLCVCCTVYSESLTAYKFKKTQRHNGDLPTCPTEHPWLLPLTITQSHLTAGSLIMVNIIMQPLQAKLCKYEVSMANAGEDVPHTAYPMSSHVSLQYIHALYHKPSDLPPCMRT